MDTLPIILLLLLLIESIIQITAGILIYKRSSHKVFRIRSSALLQISHWSDFIECIIVIYAVEEIAYNKVGYEWVLILASFVHFMNHYLFFIPFILRSYRLHLIFTIKDTESSLAHIVLKLMKRTQQSWLLKVLAVLSLPFPIIFIFVFLLSPQHFILIQGDSQDTSNNDLSVHSIAIFLTFIEQLVSIFCINSIRNIKDDYQMTKELFLVNLTWVITSPNNIFGEYSLYAYQILVRNNLVLVINSLYPLYKSYQPVAFDIPITEDILSGLLPILNHELTLGYFELFLKRRADLEYLQHPGTEFLQVWINCELLEFNPNAEVNMPAARNVLVVKDNSIPSVKISTFQVLESYFFPLFESSAEYAMCLKEINAMNIYERRINCEDLNSLQPLKPPPRP